MPLIICQTWEKIRIGINWVTHKEYTDEKSSPRLRAKNEFSHLSACIEIVTQFIVEIVHKKKSLKCLNDQTIGLKHLKTNSKRMV
jgi:hypothetical protein